MRLWSSSRRSTTLCPRLGRTMACGTLAFTRWIPCGLDKCYRGWKTDLETGYSPYEASLDRFVSLQKPAFPGRKAVVGEIERGITQRFVPLTLDDDGEADAPVCAPVMLAGQSVGLVTSGGWSFTLNKSVALAYVRSDLASPGTKLDSRLRRAPGCDRGSRAALRSRECAPTRLKGPALRIKGWRTLR